MFKFIFVLVKKKIVFKNAIKTKLKKKTTKKKKKIYSKKVSLIC